MALYSSNESSTKVDNSEEFSCINILSVDFDWIMWKIINAYNSMVREDGKTGWNDIEKQIPGINSYITFDTKKYADLCRYLGNICEELKPKDFYYGISHVEILDQVNRWMIQNPNKKFKIWNIDQHHDCGYAYEDTDEASISAILNNNMSSCANWVIMIMNFFGDRFAGYKWICNPTSEHVVKGMEEILPEFEFSEDLNLIDNVKFDKVFICLSPGWVPPQFYDLFTSMTMFLEKIINK